MHKNSILKAGKIYKVYKGWVLCKKVVGFFAEKGTHNLFTLNVSLWHLRKVNVIIRYNHKKYKKATTHMWLLWKNTADN